MIFGWRMRWESCWEWTKWLLRMKIFEPRSENAQTRLLISAGTQALGKDAQMKTVGLKVLPFCEKSASDKLAHIWRELANSTTMWHHNICRKYKQVQQSTKIRLRRLVDSSTFNGTFSPIFSQPPIRGCQQVIVLRYNCKKKAFDRLLLGGRSERGKRCLGSLKKKTEVLLVRCPSGSNDKAWERIWRTGLLLVQPHSTSFLQCFLHPQTLYHFFPLTQLIAVQKKSPCMAIQKSNYKTP